MKQQFDTKEKYVKMDKNVSDHLARTFLDNKKGIRPKGYSKEERNFIAIISFIIGICFFLILLLAYVFMFEGNISPGKAKLLVMQDKTPLIIEYDFTSLTGEKIKTLVFTLENIDLSGYNSLNLSIRTEIKSKIDSTIKVEIENTFLEKSFVYIPGAGNQWKKFSVPLSEFKDIKDWTKIINISFILESWNIGEEKGKFYIDEINFTKKIKTLKEEK